MAAAASSMRFDDLMSSSNGDNKRKHDDVGESSGDGHDAFISASELLERKKKKGMRDMYKDKISNVIGRFNSSALQVVTEFDFQGNDCVLVQQKGSTGNWPGSFETLPMRAKWLDLHGDGTLGGKFAQDKKDAKFRIVLECGTSGLLDEPYSTITDEAQAIFCERINSISDEVFWTMLKHPNIVRFLGACLEASDMCILFEMCPGSLYEYLHKHDDPMPETPLLVKMFREAALGIDPSTHHTGASPT